MLQNSLVIAALNIGFVTNDFPSPHLIELWLSQWTLSLPTHFLVPMTYLCSLE